MADIDDAKRECLERWRARSPKRRKLALQIMRGERDYDPNWPQWVVYDIKAEITLIEEGRARDAQFTDYQKRRREEREADAAAHKDFLL